MYIFSNGQFVVEVPALSSEGVYETMRTRGGRVEDLDLHLDRLYGSADIPHSRKDVEKWIYETIAKNGFFESRIRLTCAGKDILIEVTELQEEPAWVYENGVPVVTYEIERVSPEIKSGNRAAEDEAREYMKKKGAYEVLLVDRDSRVREGSVTNVFMVRGGVLVTPEKRVLPGVTRKKILELAKEKSIPVELREIPLDELLEADEVFITNSLKGVVPVVSIDGHKISDGKVGKITKQYDIKKS